MYQTAKTLLNHVLADTLPLQVFETNNITKEVNIRGSGFPQTIGNGTKHRVGLWLKSRKDLKKKPLRLTATW